jgi:hypothetical protein
MVLRNMGILLRARPASIQLRTQSGIALSEIGARFAVTTKMKFRKLERIPVI